LTVTRTRDGEVRIVERLSGRSGAITAIVFGIVIACLAALTTVRQVQWVRHHRHHADDYIGVAFVAAFALAEALLVVLVIHQTWRRTTLTADPHRVTLEFLGPFMPTWRREWATGEMGDIVPVTTKPNTGAQPRLCELQLRPPGMVISLFTDHLASELEPLAGDLNRAIGGGK
jgi:hypothetical protein